MSFFDDDLPDEAFTDTERDAGVPGLMRGGGRIQYPRSNSPKVTEADCLDLILRSLTSSGILLFNVFKLDNTLERDFDVGAFDGFTLKDVAKTSYRLEAEGYDVDVGVLLGVLRDSGLPLFFPSSNYLNPWIAWDDTRQCIVSNLQYKDSYKKRGFWGGGDAGHLLSDLTDPRRTKIFKVLRTAYLSSDHGKKPILVPDFLLNDALSKKAIPFEKPSILTVGDIDDFYLAYVMATGEVTSVPLSEAHKEKVTIATRTASYFDGRPSLNEMVLKVNGFRIALHGNPRVFQYYIRRRQGTVFQSVFARVDLPEKIFFWYTRPDLADASANAITEWACKRNAEIYITTSGHPLDSNNCEFVTTPEYYANAIKKLKELGFRIHADSGPKVNIIWDSGNVLANDDIEGPFADPWMPKGSGTK